VSSVFHIDSDELIVLDGVIGTAVDGTTAYLNTATVTWELLDKNRQPLSPPATGTLTYVAGSNGKYTAELDAAITAMLTRLAPYFLKALVVQGGYRRTFWLSGPADY